MLHQIKQHGNNLMYSANKSYYNTNEFGGLFNLLESGKTFGPNKNFEKKEGKIPYLVCIGSINNGACNIYNCTFSFFKNANRVANNAILNIR
jgi:hypothetical protein